MDLQSGPLPSILHPEPDTSKTPNPRPPNSLTENGHRKRELTPKSGLELGCKKPIAMMDGYNFNGAKMYKDTKLALTLGFHQGQTMEPLIKANRPRSNPVHEW